MKIEINKFSYDVLLEKKCVFVYGNFSEIADVICDFFIKIFKEKTSFKKVNIDAENFLNLDISQESLFETSVNVYRLSNATDSHMQLIEKKLNNSILIITPGDFIKSKKITDMFVSSKEFISIPAFKNKITYNAICKFFFPKLSPQNYDSILNIFENSNENLSSLINKLSLLCECDQNLLTEYLPIESNFISDMSPIALLRFIAAFYIKNKNLDKFSDLAFKKNIHVNCKDILSYCVDTELKIKKGENITCSMILERCLIA